MILSENIYTKAEEIIFQRRTDAEVKRTMRVNEIERKIPEIAELNRVHLANLSQRLFKIIQDGTDVEKKIEKERRDNRQAQAIIRSYLKKNGYPENYLEMEYTCPECDDTGYSNGKRCSCFKELVKKLSADELNTNSHMALSSFETFSLDYLKNEKTYESMEKIYRYCVDYAENFSPKTSRNILMYGNTGLGKTHLSLAIASEVLKKGFSVSYDSAINFLRQIENEHFGRDSSGKDTLGLILSSDLLIIDDLGAEYDNRFSAATIYNIIDTRLNRSLPVIITTNLTHHEIEERYDARIISRLGCLYDYLKFTGTDMRYLKKNNKDI